METLRKPTIVVSFFRSLGECTVIKDVCTRMLLLSFKAATVTQTALGSVVSSSTRDQSGTERQSSHGQLAMLTVTVAPLASI